MFNLKKNNSYNVAFKRMKKNWSEDEIGLACVSFRHPACCQILSQKKILLKSDQAYTVFGKGEKWNLFKIEVKKKKQLNSFSNNCLGVDWDFP